MSLSPFTRGVLVGALGLVALVWVVGGAVLWARARDADEPEPRARRIEVSGVVTSTSPRLCVEVDDVERCGLALDAVGRGVDVGDEVVGELVDVEIDPGSGPHWSLWLDLAPAP